MYANDAAVLKCGLTDWREVASMVVRISTFVLVTASNSIILNCPVPGSEKVSKHRITGFSALGTGRDNRSGAELGAKS